MIRQNTSSKRKRVDLRHRRWLLLLCLALFSQNSFAQENAEQEAKPSKTETYATTVGMPQRIVDLILPGSPLEVLPIERDAPMVVRILQTIGHGPDQNRYELEYYCLDPGEYDLAKFFRRVDGSSTDDLPAINVTVKSQLGAGQVKPHELLTRETPRVGGYRLWLILGGILWFFGLLALLFGGRKKLTPEEEAAKRISLADRLKPLVEDAMHGKLDDGKQAELERMLLTYWRGKLDLNDASAAEAITTLRKHETAGELLRQLEGWLHMPADRRQQVDVGKLLEPYRNIRASEIRTPQTSAGGKA